jgi:hypothetical protein
MWTGATVLEGDVAAALANVTLGNFRTTTNASAGAISDTHHIDAVGVLRELP